VPLCYGTPYVTSLVQIAQARYPDVFSDPAALTVLTDGITLLRPASCADLKSWFDEQVYSLPLAPFSRA
jgi:hypothetical protein